MGPPSISPAPLTTSDFPNILANVANKTLRQAYDAAPRTFVPFCRQVTAFDFKPVNRIQLSDIAALQKTNENGEFVRIYVGYSKESYALTTWGGIVPITRKVVLNDDLQALTRVPAGLGSQDGSVPSQTECDIDQEIQKIQELCMAKHPDGICTVKS